MRVFIGSRVGEGFEKSYLKLRGKYQHFSKIRWIPIENLHLTTWFIGTIDINSLPNVLALIELIQNQQKRIKLDFEKVKVAPNNLNGRMIWVKYQNNESYEKLVRKSQKYFDKVGLTEKRFPHIYPHVTIARFPEKQFQNSDFEFQKFDFSNDFLLREICIWKSILTPKGARYELIESFKLG